MTKKEQVMNSKPLLFLVGLAAVLAIGGLDLVTKAEITLCLLYALPVLFVGWFGNSGLAIAIATVAAITWCLSDFFALHRFSGRWILFLNFVSRCGCLVLIGMVSSRLKSIAGTLRTRMDRRTKELEIEIEERRRAEDKLRAREELFRQLAENINEVFWMTRVDRTQLIYISPGYERIWGKTCASLIASPGSWLEAIHLEDRERVEAALTNREVEEYNVEYRIVRPDQSIRWIRDRAFPIRDAQGLVYRFAGIAEDITESKRTELALLEISEREQARIGQDLHDELCQLLVSIAFDCNRLQEHLGSIDTLQAKAAGHIAGLVDEAISQARQVARGLYPVRLEADGLRSALEELAANTTTRFKLSCKLQCGDGIYCADQSMATHLYRIAQEAVSNALRHAHPTHIQITLRETGSELRLEVLDDGQGIPRHQTKPGMGLQIMGYRARTIGGRLGISDGQQGGTLISCSLPLPRKGTSAA